MNTRLFVGNLTRATTEEDLSALFAKVGEVASVEVISVPKTGHPNCFAFVDMGTAMEAKKAIDVLDGSHLHSRAIRVKIAGPREKRPESGGWYNDLPYPKKSSRNTGKKLT